MVDRPKLPPPNEVVPPAFEGPGSIEEGATTEILLLKVGENQFTYGRRDINRTSLSITGVTPETADAMIRIENARADAVRARAEAARETVRMRSEAAMKQAEEATRQAQERTKQIEQQSALAINQAQEETARSREATKQAQQETLRERELTAQSEETTKRSGHQISKAALVCGVVLAAVVAAAWVPAAAVAIGVIVTVLGGIAAGTYTLTERGKRSKQLSPPAVPKALPPRKDTPRSND